MSPVLIGAGLAAGNHALNAIGIGQQTAASKDLMDYQWKNFMSPQAQVRNMAAAGLNPAAVLSEGKGSFASPSVAMPSVSPVQMDGVDTLANYLVAKTQAEKNKVDTKLTDTEIQAKQFELELSKTFAKPERISNLLSAFKNLRAQDDEHNLKQWQISKEKFLSVLSGIQKDTAQKVLDNMDYQIQQENRKREEDIKLTQEKQKTEKTSQSANVASANASNTQADVNRAVRRLQSALADVEESGKTYKIESLISEYQKNKSISDADAKEANIKLSRLRELEYKRDSRLFGEVDNFLEWIKGKVSIFH